MKSSQRLPSEWSVSNSKGLAVVPDRAEFLDRDFGLKINSRPSRGVYQIIPLGNKFPPHEDLETIIPFGCCELFGYAQACREVWERQIVDYKETVTGAFGKGQQYFMPFQEQLDQSTHPEILREKGAHLALAGKRLFTQIFEQSANILTIAEAEKRRHLAESIRNIMAYSNRSCLVTVTSDDFFVPWGMLYTHPDPAELLRPDGSNFQWDGFWGMRHIIEHRTRDAPAGNRIRPDRTGRVQMSLNIDELLDNCGVRCIASQLEFFTSLSGLNLVHRRKKPELRDALQAVDFQDRIVYFFCHGEGGGRPDSPNLCDAKLVLTDQEKITCQDIMDWLGERHLASQPVVFINACQGGQMHTLFYRTIAAELLRRRAACIIGSQIDIPAVFADAYAQRFFARLFSDNPPNRPRIGPIVRDLARDLLTHNGNPLGLVYSLYRGADCFVDSCSQ